MNLSRHDDCRVRHFAPYGPADARIIGRRDRGVCRRLRLSHVAELELLYFHEETSRQRSDQERWVKRGPLKAVKIALILHVWKGDGGNEISEATMAAAIAVTRWLNQQPATTDSTCAAAEQDHEIREAAAHMLEKLQRLVDRLHRPVTRRELYQLYDDERRALFTTPNHECRKRRSFH